MTELAAFLALSPADTAMLAVIVFLAGIVRGFTGFALSAFVLSTAVTILPPVALIPMLFWLEMSASLMMVRSGWRAADLRATGFLILGGAIGTFAGVGALAFMDPEASRITALTLLVTLAAAQLTPFRIPGLATAGGTLATGLAAGLANGMAGIGGMVVALYVLMRRASPQKMRATLVIYLFAGMATSLLTHLWWGTMTGFAVARAAVFLPLCLAGVFLGMRLFTPRWQRYYRPVSLWLLILLGLAALARVVV